MPKKRARQRVVVNTDMSFIHVLYREYEQVRGQTSNIMELFDVPSARLFIHNSGNIGL